VARNLAGTTPASQPINQSISQSVNQSISQSVNRSTSQSVNQSVSQRVSVPVPNLVLKAQAQGRGLERDFGGGIVQA
jgi:hypothetical protein